MSIYRGYTKEDIKEDIHRILIETLEKKIEKNSRSCYNKTLAN